MKPIYDKLQRYVDSGDNEKAAEEMNRLLKTGQHVDDEFAVPAAVIASRLGDEELAWVFIREGLLGNGRNAMLYFLLGNYYEDKNVNQAWLCYENAEYYCGSEEELALIRQRKTVMEEQGEWSVNKISVVILTQDLKDNKVPCIRNLRETLPPDSYELVVTENASSDGIYDCNQGIKAAAAENDIMLLNSDALVPANAVFWLRMGLYEDGRTGAVWSVSEHRERMNVPEKTRMRIR